MSIGLGTGWGDCNHECLDGFVRSHAQGKSARDPFAIMFDPVTAQESNQFTKPPFFYETQCSGSHSPIHSTEKKETKYKRHRDKVHTAETHLS
eukprot:1651285-Amphidinium_carterae.1